MAQCEAKTLKGERCRNQATAKSRFCNTHASAGEGDRPDPFAFLDELSESQRTLLGVLICGAIVLYAIVKRG